MRSFLVLCLLTAVLVGVVAADDRLSVPHGMGGGDDDDHADDGDIDYGHGGDYCRPEFHVTCRDCPPCICVGDVLTLEEAIVRAAATVPDGDRAAWVASIADRLLPRGD